jgi:phage gpG-like protein
MITFSIRTLWEGDAVIKKMTAATYTTLNHAAASIRLIARRSIKRGKSASSPGTPPNTRRGRLTDAIRYSVDKSKRVALVGPTESVVGEAGAAHEFGGYFRGTNYPKRPFMGPALAQAAPRLPETWAASLKH